MAYRKNINLKSLGFFDSFLSRASTTGVTSANGFPLSFTTSANMVILAHKKVFRTYLHVICCWATIPGPNCLVTISIPDPLQVLHLIIASFLGDLERLGTKIIIGCYPAPEHPGQIIRFWNSNVFVEPLKSSSSDNEMV